MQGRKTASIVVTIIFLWLGRGAAVAGDSNPPKKDVQEFSQELARVKAAEHAFTSGPTNDLARYEKFADDIQKRWSQRNKEDYGRLVSAVCGTLSSGCFDDWRAYELARKYALSALENADAIPVTLELELTGHVMTLTVGPAALSGRNFAQHRRRDAEVHLHAWKRLLAAIDSMWDPRERIPVYPNLPPGVHGVGVGFPVAPEAIKDPALRAQYEAAIKENNRKRERHAEQRRLRDRLRGFSGQAQSYIIQLYSTPPFDAAELRELLGRYLSDAKTRAQILEAVAKAEEEAKNAAKTNARSGSPTPK